MHPTLLRVRDALKSSLARDHFLMLLRVEAGFAKTCARALSLLPMRQQTQIKERLNPVGVLDYPRAEIRMTLSDAPELMRLRSCKKEPETIAWLEQVLRPTDVMFDVGANVGAYSFVAARFGGEMCRVFAFEPSFSTFASLSRNIQLNSLAGRVVPFQIAFADRTGTVNFSYRDLRAGSAEHGSGDDDSFTPVYRQPTLAYRLDDFVAEFAIPMPTVMKIDVDGAELRVLQGAPRVLANPSLRALQVEADERVASDAVALIEANGLQLVSRRQRSSGIANFVFARTAP